MTDIVGTHEVGSDIVGDAADGAIDGGAREVGSDVVGDAVDEAIDGGAREVGLDDINISIRYKYSKYRYCI